MKDLPGQPEVVCFVQWLRSVMDDVGVSQVRLAKHLGIRDKNKISKELRGDEHLPAWEYVEPNYLIPIEEIIGRLLSAEDIAEGRRLYALAEKVATPHMPIPRLELEAQVIALMRKCHQLTEELLQAARREVELRDDLAVARAEIAAGARHTAQELAQARARGRTLETEVERHRELLGEMRAQATTRDAELTRLNIDLQLAQTSAGYAVELEAELRRLRSSRALADAVAEGRSWTEASATPPGNTPIEVLNPALSPATPEEQGIFWNDGRALDMRALTPIPHLDRWWTTALTTMAEIISAGAIVLLALAVLAVMVFGPPFWLWGWQGGVATAVALLLLAISAPTSREALLMLVVAVGDALYTLIAFVLSTPIRLTLLLITTLRTTRPAGQPRLMRVLASLVGDDFHAWRGVVLPGTAGEYLVACHSGVYVLVPQQAWQPDVATLAAAVARVSPIGIGDDRVPVVVVAVCDISVGPDLSAVNGVHVVRTSHVRSWITRRPSHLPNRLLDRIVTSLPQRSF